MPKNISQHLQDLIILLAITDTGFLKLTHGRVDPKHLTSRITANLLEIIFQHYKEFGEAPGYHHFWPELEHFLETRPIDEADEYLKYVTKLQKLQPPGDRTFVLRRLGDFVKGRERELALIKAADLIQEDKIEEADNVLYDVLKTGVPEEDMGLDYLRDYTGMDQQQEGILIPTGVPALDRLIGGYSRGQLLTILAGSKGGKTWALMHVAKTGLYTGLKVLHITHEVSQSETEQRYDMMFCCRGSKNVGEVVAYQTYDNKTGKMAEQRRVIRNLFEDKNIRVRARRAVKKFGGDIRIKKYPMGQCKPSEILRYLNDLETRDGFLPDIIINDYIDVMDLSGYGDQKRDQLNEGYIFLKGLADDRNVLVATASQVRREALKRRVITQKDVAEDIRKMANCDIAIAIGRSDDDIKCNLAGLNVIANRTGRQDCGCTISMSFDIGQFCLGSWIGKELDEEVFSKFLEKEDE